MKAMDHAVERLYNPVRSPYADALAEAGLKGLEQGLLATKAHPDEMDARLECQIGIWLAIGAQRRSGPRGQSRPSATPSAAPFACRMA